MLQPEPIMAQPTDAAFGNQFTIEARYTYNLFGTQNLLSPTYPSY